MRRVRILICMLFAAQIASATSINVPGQQPAIQVEIRNDMEALPYSIAANHPPILDSIGPQVIYEGECLELIVIASDFDGDSLFLTAVNIPENSTFSDSGNGHGLFVFCPDYNQSGQYQITFVVSDGQLTDTLQIVIIVQDADPQLLGIYFEGNDTLLHVINHTPLIAWSYHDPTGQNPQMQFEIAVGTDNDWEYAEMWNPAPIPGPDTSIVYAGSVLVDGETYYLRLRVNNGYIWSDWYETSFRMNTPPSVPIQLYPLDFAVVNDSQPTLWIQNSIDAEGDDLFYDFTVEFDCVMVAGSNISQQIDSTGWKVDTPLDDNLLHLWYARAYDGYEYSDWSGREFFWVNAEGDYPSAFDLYFPPDTDWGQITEFPTIFWWGTSTDPDPFDSVYYRLFVAIDSQFTFVATYDSIYQTTSDAPTLQYSTHYWWKVYAIDTKGNETRSNGIADFLTWVLGDTNQDGVVDVGDAVFLINYIFKYGYTPYPLKRGDINGDCGVNVADAVYLINYIFKSGPAPEVGCAEKPKAVGIEREIED